MHAERHIHQTFSTTNTPQPTPAGGVGEIFIVSTGIDHRSANHIDRFVENPPAGAAVVLICDRAELTRSIDRLQAAGISRITPIDRNGADLHGTLEAAIQSLRIKRASSDPSRSVLRAARACMTPWREDVLGDLNPTAEALSRLAAGPVEFIAATMLSMVGGVSAGRFEIEVRPGFRVNPIVWSVLVGDPSSQKSPSMDLVVDPLRRIEARLRASARLAKKAAEAAHDALGKRGKPEKVLEPRMMISDATVEAAQHVCADQGRGLFATYDELSIWFSSIYRKGGVGDVGLWLRAYAGGPMDVDRRGLPEPLHIPQWAVGVVAAVPPAVLDQYAHAGSLLVDDGFDARLNYVFPSPPPLSLRPASGDDAAIKKWESIVDRLVTWRLQASGMDTIRFDVDALEAFERWRLEMLTDARRGGRDVSSWDGKRPGLVARYAGLISILDAAVQGVTPRVVTLDQLKRAGRYVDLLTAHRRRVELVRGTPSIERVTSELAGWIIQHGARVLDTFELRGVVPGLRGRNVRDALRELDAAGWFATPVPTRNDEPMPRCIVVEARVFELFGAT